MKRINYSTPKNYLDFLINYKKLLSENRKNITNAIKRFESGLLTMSKAKQDVEVL